MPAQTNPARTPADPDTAWTPPDATPHEAALTPPDLLDDPATDGPELDGPEMPDPDGSHHRL
jgi:hypothetical protein